MGLSSLTRELFKSSRPAKPVKPEEWGERQRLAREAHEALEHPALKRAFADLDEAAVAAFRAAQTADELVEARRKLEALEELKGALWSRVHEHAHAELNKAKG